MNRHIAITISCFITMFSFASDDYVITINGKSHDIGLDSNKEIAMEDGTKLSVELKMKDELQYDRPYFSFSHSSKYKASGSDLGDGVFQSLLNTPEGAVILIQEYSNIDPSSLIDLMMNELTKEEIDYGYKYKETKLSKQAGSTKVLGKQGVTTHKDDNWVREVCAVGGKDCGVLIVTAIETQSNSKEQYLIDNFWETLRIKELH